MRGGIFTIIVVFVLALCLAQVTQALTGCGIRTEHGLEPDYDCDGLVDYVDNCPFFANSQQEDINRNGVGDYCDLLIEEIVVNPDTHIRQGEFATLTARVINNREGPLEDISVQAKSSRLGLDTVQEISYLPSGESAVTEFWFRIPKCQDEGSYAISLTTVLRDPLTGKRFTEAQSQEITVEAGDVCGTADGPLDGTIIDVLERVDVDRGESAIIPINVVNLGASQATYHFTVQPLGSWGTWRVDPSPSIAIPEGNDGSVYLYLNTERHTWPGTQTVYLVVASDNQQTTIPIDVYVRAPASASIGTGFWTLLIQWLLVLALLFLIVAAIVIAVVHMGKGNGKEPVVVPAAEKTARKTARKTTKKSAKKVSVEPVKRQKRETYY